MSEGRILVVDDDRDIRTFVGVSLELAGFEVVEAGDGLEAIERAREDAPDAIVMDVMMPKLDGLQAVRRIRDDERLRYIPVIMLTAKTQTHDKLAGFDAGANDYLTKPFDPSELVARIGAQLGRPAIPQGDPSPRGAATTMHRDRSADRWDVFLSHAAVDKQTFVEPLAQLLIQEGLRVWYDDYELQLGDSIRQGIDRGLSLSNLGLVVLSPAFLKGRAWTERELSGLFAAGKRIVPVFFDVSPSEVAQYSPLVADRRGLVAVELGLEKMARMVADLATVEIAEA